VRVPAPAIEALGALSASPVPDDLAVVLGGATLTPVAAPADGRHAAAVWSGETADGRAIFVKTAPAVDGDDASGAQLLAAETVRLRWLRDRAPVPEVLAWSVGADGRAFLVTTALAGAPATAPEHRGDAELLVATVARALRRLHDLPIDDCPFDSRLAGQLATAERRVELGLVDQSDFEEPYRPYSPARLFELLVDSMPAHDEDLVVVHGDCTLDNLILDGGEVTGFVDVGRSGVGDRYLDLAVIARELAHHVSPASLGPFFDLYGLDRPELRKVDFYVLLDEIC
jgi:kanamycin kinase/aminoglycoside 3'-phosphotransferase-2